MSYTIETKKLPSGFTVEVVTDDYPENPVETWDMVGTMVLGYHCRYDFGHCKADHETLLEISNDPANIVLPVYLYDHSGITISTSPFSCPWDSGQVGVMYCTHERATSEFGGKSTHEVREAATKCMTSEVESINSYLVGDVYGYRVLDPAGEEVFSLWGFVGDADYCMGEGVSAAAVYEARAEVEAVERDYWKARDVCTV